MRHLLAFDLSNLCYIGAAISVSKGEDSVEHFFEKTRDYIRSQYRYFKPDEVVFACDHEAAYWRSTFYPDYKAHRADNAFKQKVREVIKRFKAENSHLCLEEAECEADDVIYGLCQYTNFQVTIVSSDGDFEQLLCDRVRVFTPNQFRFRMRPPDVAFNLFVKCIRGDRSDNIPAALPMVTLKRLKQAYQQKEPIEFLAKQYRLSPDLTNHYQRNRTLIDLSQLPDKLKAKLQTRIAGHFKLH